MQIVPDFGRRWGTGAGDYTAQHGVRMFVMFVMFVFLCADICTACVRLYFCCVALLLLLSPLLAAAALLPYCYGVAQPSNRKLIFCCAKNATYKLATGAPLFRILRDVPSHVHTAREGDGVYAAVLLR